MSEIDELVINMMADNLKELTTIVKKQQMMINELIWRTNRLDSLCRDIIKVCCIVGK